MNCTLRTRALLLSSAAAAVAYSALVVVVIVIVIVAAALSLLVLLVLLLMLLLILLVLVVVAVVVLVVVFIPVVAQRVAEAVDQLRQPLPRQRRRLANDGRAETPREDREVTFADLAVVVEVALREVAPALAEVGAQDVEVVAIDRAVVVGVAAEEEELERVITGQLRAVGRAHAGGAQRRAVLAVGELALRQAGERERRHVRAGVVAGRDGAGRDRLARREVLQRQVVAADAARDVGAERELQLVRAR